VIFVIAIYLFNLSSGVH